MIHVIALIAIVVCIAWLIKGIIRERRAMREIDAAIRAADAAREAEAVQPNWYHQHRGVSVWDGLSGDDLADWCQHIVWDYAREMHA